MKRQKALECGHSGVGLSAYCPRKKKDRHPKKGSAVNFVLSELRNLLLVTLLLQHLALLVLAHFLSPLLDHASHFMTSRALDFYR